MSMPRFDINQYNKLSAATDPSFGQWSCTLE
jgi:hypothetical protein